MSEDRCRGRNPQVSTQPTTPAYESEATHSQNQNLISKNNPKTPPQTPRQQANIMPKAPTKNQPTKNTKKSGAGAIGNPRNNRQFHRLSVALGKKIACAGRGEGIQKKEERYGGNKKTSVTAAAVAAAAAGKTTCAGGSGGGGGKNSSAFSSNQRELAGGGLMDRYRSPTHSAPKNDFQPANHAHALGYVDRYVPSYHTPPRNVDAPDGTSSSLRSSAGSVALGGGVRPINSAPGNTNLPLISPALRNRMTTDDGFKRFAESTRALLKDADTKNRAATDLLLWEAYEASRMRVPSWTIAGGPPKRVRVRQPLPPPGVLAPEPSTPKRIRQPIRTAAETRRRRSAAPGIRTPRNKGNAKSEMTHEQAKKPQMAIVANSSVPIDRERGDGCDPLFQKLDLAVGEACRSPPLPPTPKTAQVLASPFALGIKPLTIGGFADGRIVAAAGPSALGVGRMTNCGNTNGRSVMNPPTQILTIFGYTNRNIAGPSAFGTKHKTTSTNTNRRIIPGIGGLTLYPGAIRTVPRCLWKTRIKHLPKKQITSIQTHAPQNRHRERSASPPLRTSPFRQREVLPRSTRYPGTNIRKDEFLGKECYSRDPAVFGYNGPRISNIHVRDGEITGREYHIPNQARFGYTESPRIPSIHIRKGEIIGRECYTRDPAAFGPQTSGIHSRDDGFPGREQHMRNQATPSYTGPVNTPKPRPSTLPGQSPKSPWLVHDYDSDGSASPAPGVGIPERIGITEFVQKTNPLNPQAITTNFNSPLARALNPPANTVGNTRPYQVANPFHTPQNNSRNPPFDHGQVSSVDRFHFSSSVPPPRPLFQQSHYPEMSYMNPNVFLQNPRYWNPASAPHFQSDFPAMDYGQLQSGPSTPQVWGRQEFRKTGYSRDAPMLIDDDDNWEWVSA